MSTFLDLLTAEVTRDPEAAAQLAAALRPHLATEDRPPRLLDPGEAATQLGVHPRTLVRAANADRVTGAVRVGRGWRFDAATLALAPPERNAPAPPPPPRRRPARSAAAAAIKGAPNATTRRPPTERTRP